MNFIRVIILLFLSSACVHKYDYVDLTQVPIEIRQKFTGCSKNDGETVIQLFDGADKRYITQEEVEWVVNDQQGWKLAAYNRLGKEDLRLRIKASNLVVSGRFRKYFSKLKVHQGFLNYDEYFIGIKAQEVKCLLPYLWPRSWLLNLVDFSSSAGKTRMLFYEQRREIVINIDATKNETCTLFRWSKYLGLLTSSVNWCQKLDKSKKFTENNLVLPKDKELRWKIAN